MSLQSIVDRVLTVGIPAYVDLQQSKLRVNDPTPGIQNPDGTYSAQGQSVYARGIAGVPTWVWVVGGLAAVGLIVFAVRK